VHRSVSEAKLSPATASHVERSRGALLGTFVGDALGMPYEGAGPEAIPEELDMREARLGRGTYTDDTEMMIALAECLVQQGAVNPASLAGHFLAVCDPRRGYGEGTLRVLTYWREGIPVNVAARLVFGGQGSLGNGAAMRIAPIGVRFAADPERLRSEARRSATTTHAHPPGDRRRPRPGGRCRGRHAR
jgi:poly(ADP-ribose) glycohydrolase ARH3